MIENTNLSELSNYLQEISLHAANINNIKYLSDKNSTHLVHTLEKTTETLEKVVIISRNTLEQIRPFTEPDKSTSAVLPSVHVAGTVRIMEMGWLHIKLNTLLPNCRYQTPQYLCDTLVRLLDDFKRQGKRLPYFNKAMLVIDEYCTNESRNVFDNDNKGWKAISNTLKGRIFPDDDQFSLGVALVATYANELACNIYVMDASDAGEFFMVRANGLLNW